MSADNFYLIRKHPDGGYAVVMGFASDTDEDGESLAPEVTDQDPKFATMWAALTWAMDQYSEYGVSLHPECLEPPDGDPGTPGPRAGA